MFICILTKIKSNSTLNNKILEQMTSLQKKKVSTNVNLSNDETI